VTDSSVGNTHVRARAHTWTHAHTLNKYTNARTVYVCVLSQNYLEMYRSMEPDFGKTMQGAMLGTGICMHQTTKCLITLICIV
jgi:hypothetical protein